MTSLQYDFGTLLWNKKHGQLPIGVSIYLPLHYFVCNMKPKIDEVHYNHQQIETKKFENSLAIIRFFFFFKKKKAWIDSSNWVFISI